MACSLHSARFIISLFLLIPLSALGQTAGKRPSKLPTKKSPIAASKGMKIVYGSNPWNKDSSKIDNAFLFFRDAKSGKVAKVVLEESEPDSSTFSGQFAIGWATVEKIDPEVYIPPKGMRDDSRATSQFLALLRAKKVKRRPIVFKKGEQGVQVLDVYDTREQAEKALKAYETEKKIMAEKKSLSQPIPSKSTLETAKMVEKKSLLTQLAAEAAQRESERIRLEQLERQKQETLKKQQEALAAKERERRKLRAQKLAAKAMEHYRAGEFVEAENLFRQSVELDPSNTSYYFNYGVALYRNQKYNESIVTLNIAPEDPNTRLEKKYYVAMGHFRLKELDQSLKLFKELKETKHPVLSPSSAFYEGMILFGQEKYEPAKNSFEFVLDNSKDPRMDEKAEEFIEKIARIQRFKKNQSKTFLFTATVGATYDSNILFAPDNVESQGSSTNKGGMRLLGTGGAEYRPIYNQKREFSTKLNTTYMYSLDDEFTRADPWANAFTAPYTLKGLWNKKGYKLTFSPGYEWMHMNIDEKGSPENILNSIVLNSDLTLVMSQTWFANYNFELQQDDSLLTITDDADDADAMKYTLATKHTLFLDKAKKRAILVGGGYILNSAKGKNKKYNRLDLNFSFMAPIKKWDATWLAGATAYTLNYDQSTGHRRDTNFGVNLALSKPFYEWFTGGLVATYANNNSTNSDNQYSRYSIMSTASFNWGL